jgi:hypothetical protein
MDIALAKRHMGVLIAGASDEINFLGAPGERLGFFNCLGFGDAIECALFLVCLKMVFILGVIDTGVLTKLRKKDCFHQTNFCEMGKGASDF